MSDCLLVVMDMGEVDFIHAFREAKIKTQAGAPFRKPDGTVDYVALFSFLNQMNVLLGHPYRRFRPIEGDRFLL